MVENLWLEIHGVILCSDEFIIFVSFCFVNLGHSFSGTCIVFGIMESYS